MDRRRREWLASAPDRALAEQALARAELVIVNEMFFTPTVERAHVVFPVASFAEKEGVVVNCERRLQRTVRAVATQKGARGRTGRCSRRWARRSG